MTGTNKVGCRALFFVVAPKKHTCVDKFEYMCYTCYNKFGQI